MILKTLLGLAAVFGIYWAIRQKKTLPLIITIGMVIGIAMAFCPSVVVKTYGFYVYMGFTALAFIYGATLKEKKILSRVIICLMSGSIFLYWLWALNHWHGNTMLLPILTLLTVLTAFLTRPKLKSELGFLTILTIDAITIILEMWMKAG